MAIEIDDFWCCHLDGLKGLQQRFTLPCIHNVSSMRQSHYVTRKKELEQLCLQFCVSLFEISNLAQLIASTGTAFAMQIQSDWAWSILLAKAQKQCHDCEAIVAILVLSNVDGLTHCQAQIHSHFEQTFFMFIVVHHPWKQLLLWFGHCQWWKNC